MNTNNNKSSYDEYIDSIASELEVTDNLHLYALLDTNIIDTNYLQEINIPADSQRKLTPNNVITPTQPSGKYSAPILVELENKLEPLKKLIADGWHKHWAVYLKSPATLDELFDYINTASCSVETKPNTNPWLYNSKVLNRLLKHISPKKRPDSQKLDCGPNLGPIDSIHIKSLGIVRPTKYSQSGCSPSSKFKLSLSENDWQSIFSSPTAPSKKSYLIISIDDLDGQPKKYEKLARFLKSQNDKNAPVPVTLFPHEKCNKDTMEKMMTGIPCHIGWHGVLSTEKAGILAKPADLEEINKKLINGRVVDCQVIAWTFGLKDPEATQKAAEYQNNLKDKKSSIRGSYPTIARGTRGNTGYLCDSSDKSCAPYDLYDLPSISLSDKGLQAFQFERLDDALTRGNRLISLHLHNDAGHQFLEEIVDAFHEHGSEIIYQRHIPNSQEHQKQEAPKACSMT